MTGDKNNALPESTVGKTQEKVDMKVLGRKEAIERYKRKPRIKDDPMMRGGFISDLDSLDEYEDE